MNHLTTTAVKHIVAFAVLLGFSPLASAGDVSHRPLKDLNGCFPFNPPGSLSEWEQLTTASSS